MMQQNSNRLSYSTATKRGYLKEVLKIFSHTLAGVTQADASMAVLLMAMLAAAHRCSQDLIVISS